MDDIRRGKIQSIVRLLAELQEQVHELWLDEEVKFEARSVASKESSAGTLSQEAMGHLENTVAHIEEAKFELNSACDVRSGP